MSVLFYHFTYRWALQFPGTGFYGSFFQYAYLGVQFFFVISGFVISYTLENTANLSSFFKNRFIRLFPPLLLCTLITYGVAALLDKGGDVPFAHQPVNLLPSLTMINPALWTYLIHRPVAWINGSYWSLWVELEFYFIAAILYFSARGSFFRNLLVTTIVVTIVKYIPPVVLHFAAGTAYRSVMPFFASWKTITGLFKIVFYLPWFTLGALFYQWYKGVRWWADRQLRLLVLIVLCLQYTDLYIYSGWVLQICISIFFLVLIYKREYLGFLDLPVFKRIGVISYSMYLIHEVIGILLLLKWNTVLKHNPLLPILMICLTILFAELSYRFYEQPVSGWLKRKLFPVTLTNP